MNRFLIIVFFLSCFSLSCPLTADTYTIKDIKTKYTFHQKVTGFTISLTTEEMDFFLDNLPYASYLLNKYKIHSLKIVRESADRYYAEDSRGLKGTFWLVEKEDSFRVYKGHGSIDNRIIGVLSADVVATIYYENCPFEVISNDLEFWVLVNNSFLDFLCRIFRPILKGILKNKVKVFVNTIQKFAENFRADDTNTRIP